MRGVAFFFLHAAAFHRVNSARAEFAAVGWIGVLDLPAIREIRNVSERESVSHAGRP